MKTSFSQRVPQLVLEGLNDLGSIPFLWPQIDYKQISFHGAAVSVELRSWLKSWALGKRFTSSWAGGEQRSHGLHIPRPLHETCDICDMNARFIRHNHIQSDIHTYIYIYILCTVYIEANICPVPSRSQRDCLLVVNVSTKVSWRFFPSQEWWKAPHQELGLREAYSLDFKTFSLGPKIPFN